MTVTTIDQGALAAAVAAELAKRTATAPGISFAPTGATGSPFAAPIAAPAPAGAAPLGVLVQMTIPIHDAGVDVPIQILFGPEHASPTALYALLNQLKAAGWPLKSYPQRREEGGWNDRGGGRGGWRGGRDRGGSWR